MPLLETEVERVEPDITLVRLTGKIVLGPDTQKLEALVHDLLRREQKKIVFDLSGVSYIDSTGMGVIVSCLSKLKKPTGLVPVGAEP